MSIRGFRSSGRDTLVGLCMTMLAGCDGEQAGGLDAATPAGGNEHPPTGAVADSGARTVPSKPPDCAAECVDGVEARPLACGCDRAPCDQGLSDFLSESCEGNAEVVMFPCDEGSVFVRVIDGQGLFVFAFRDDSLVGFQQGEAEDNACGGGHRYFGEQLACETVADAGAFDSASEDPCR